MWKFSKHILARMAERNYSEEEVLKVLNEEVPVLILASPQDKTIDIYFGKVGRKHFMIPANKKTKNLITIRAMRKNEKLAYSKEFKDE